MTNGATTTPSVSLGRHEGWKSEAALARHARASLAHPTRHGLLSESSHAITTYAASDNPFPDSFDPTQPYSGSLFRLLAARMATAASCMQDHVADLVYIGRPAGQWMPAYERSVERTRQYAAGTFPCDFEWRGLYCRGVGL